MVCVSWYSFTNGLPGRIWSQRVMVRCVCSPISLRRPWSFRKRMAVTGNDLGTFNSLKEQGERGWFGIWKMVAEQFSKKKKRLPLIFSSITVCIILRFIAIPLSCHSSQVNISRGFVSWPTEASATTPPTVQPWGIGFKRKKRNGWSTSLTMARTLSSPCFYVGEEEAGS